MEFKAATQGRRTRTFFWSATMRSQTRGPRSPDNCAWLARKLGKCIIERPVEKSAAQSLDCFLESGMGPGLEFAITYASEIVTIPVKDRRETTAATTYPFGCSRQRLILIRAGGNQSALFHLTCGRIVHPTGPADGTACAVFRQPERNSVAICVTAERAFRLHESAESGNSQGKQRRPTADP